MAEALVRRGHQVVAIDCRGRGQSEITRPGTYGLAAHARDVAEIAAELGRQELAFVGWSMGALIGMNVAQCAPGLVKQLVLLDHTGPVDLDAISLVRASVARLDAVVDEPTEYFDAVRSRGVIDPWTPFWTDHYRYELRQREHGSWAPTTDRAACEEDLEDSLRDYDDLWAGLTMPTTLIRAAEPMAGARLVSDRARDAFAEAVHDAAVIEVPANHYTVMTDPAMLAAVIDRLAS